MCHKGEEDTLLAPQMQLALRQFARNPTFFLCCLAVVPGDTGINHNARVDQQ